MYNQYVDEAATSSELKACKFPLNRTYLDTDTIVPDDYVFTAPNDWVGSRAPNKCIGLREARLEPYPQEFDLTFTINYIFDPPLADGTEEKQIYFATHHVNIASSNTLYDIMANMDKMITGDYKAEGWYQGDPAINYYVEFQSSYDAAANQLKFTFDSTFPFINMFDYLQIRIAYREGWQELKRVFNQPDYPYEGIRISEGAIVELDNVWDRTRLFIHSSISEDNQQILCENGKDYEPKRYLFPTCQPTFRVWFTTNGRTPIKIYNSWFILKLAYIYNFREAAL